ncbi:MULTISPECIES: hypothetical protein [Methylotenera]|uniref:hypothetical protein n=1 Tax=Methylotenera TaxID=359407 RepID=UPI00037CA8AE|nr:MULTISPECIES: hypothetical protein [Methylotenera]
MSPDKQKNLILNFPKLYRKFNPNDLSLMNSALYVGDGWYDLLYRLSGSLENTAESEDIDPHSESWPAAMQVKSKFGSLKFYCRTGKKEEQNFVVEQFGEVISVRPLPSNAYMADLISIAEKDSKEICEECGEAGYLRTVKLIKTLCDSCYKMKT